MKSKSKRWEKIIENSGKVLIDAGKLTFASFVLGSILNGNIERAYLLSWGSIVAFILVALGIYLTSRSD